MRRFEGYSPEGSSSNDTSPMTTSSPGSNPARSQGRDHADLAQPSLQVVEGLLVGEVVTRDQHLDAAASDPPAAVAVRLDLEAPLLAGPVDPVLGLSRLAGRRTAGPVLRKRGEDRPNQLVEAGPGRRGDRQDPSVPAHGRAATLDEPRRPRSAGAGRTWRGRSSPPAARARRRSRPARRERPRSWTRARPRPAPARPGGRAGGSARRARGTRGRARRPRRRPRSALGCRRAPTGGPRARSFRARARGS